MAGNSNVHASRSKKEDEFYTQMSLVESELKHYKDHFKDKVVFCNCDDPEWSAFWQYFYLNYSFLNLKGLISTHYDAEDVTFKLEYDGVETKETKLIGNGDFRNEECLSILKSADIIVTNPPFSLFREYIAMLMEYDKKFLIIGNQNALSYREIFPLVKENKMWLGYNNGHFWFRVPDWYEEKKTDFKIDEKGVKWRRMGNICWYTNLDIQKRHENMILYKAYSPDEYPTYDNYNAIEVGRTADIPIDFDGAMGVPLTFMCNFNPDQFELIGQTHSGDTSPEVEALRTDPNHRHGGRINGKEKFARILIRRKQ